LAVTETVSVTVTGAAVTPVLVEDFSTYTDTANMLADPRGIYLLGEEFRTDRMTLDTTLGYSGLTQCMRYDYPAGTGTDYTISRMLDMPTGASTEVWVEAVIRWDADFTIAGNGQGAGAAQKLLHVEQTGAAGRFAVNLEQTTMRAEGPNDNYAAFYINNGLTNVSALFDAQWHVLRYHVRLGASDFHEFWLDGVPQGSASAVSAAASLWGIALARNLNMQSAIDMSMYWGRVRIYNTDPGWV